jgi:hypothetical protein
MTMLKPSSPVCLIVPDHLSALVGHAATSQTLVEALRKKVVTLGYAYTTITFCLEGQLDAMVDREYVRSVFDIYSTLVTVHGSVGGELDAPIMELRYFHELEKWVRWGDIHWKTLLSDDEFLKWAVRAPAPWNVCPIGATAVHVESDGHVPDDPFPTRTFDGTQWKDAAR